MSEQRNAYATSDEEHFPWHYTEFGVVCACGKSMRDEACPDQQEVVHLLNAYTWAGRRGACGITSEWLPSVHDRAEVTCAACLATPDNEGSHAHG